MKPTRDAVSIAEKEKNRMQINAQVNEFIRSGGRIRVVGNNGETRRGTAGNAWREQEDLLEFGSLQD
jgi:hypothetical protein